MYIRRSRAELVKAGHFTKRSSSSTSTPTSSATTTNEEPIAATLKRKKLKHKKNGSIPKHPLSAYMWYLTEVRPETMRNYPGSNVGQISKLCAERWNTMSEDARLPWKIKAESDKGRYAREMQIYALQNDHHLGRGTRQKYRPSTTTLDLSHHQQQDNTTSFVVDDTVPIFYTDDKLYQLPTTSSNSILHNPMTLNPNALLHNNHHNQNDSYH